MIIKLSIEKSTPWTLSGFHLVDLLEVAGRLFAKILIKKRTVVHLWCDHSNSYERGEIVDAYQEGKFDYVVWNLQSTKSHIVVAS